MTIKKPASKKTVKKPAKVYKKKPSTVKASTKIKTSEVKPVTQCNLSTKALSLLAEPELPQTLTDKTERTSGMLSLQDALQGMRSSAHSPKKPHWL